MGINLGDAILHFLGDTADVDAKVAGLADKAERAGVRAERGLARVTKMLNRIGKLALLAGGAFVAWKVVTGIRDAVRASIEFEKAFANVTTLIDTKTPGAQKQIQRLRQDILALAPELGSATELTNGLYQALSAGAEPAQAVQLVGEAAQFAKAALTDTFTAVDVMTTILNAYGKSAEDAQAVSSVLFKTIEQGKTTGQELAGALGRVIPVAAALNVEIPEVGAALATLTKSGLATSEAVTSLRAILKTLLSPESAKRFDELGISQAKLRDIISKRGLNAALQELGKLLKGDTAATANLFREQEAQVGVFTLLGAGADEYGRILGELTQAEIDGTATADAFEKQQQTLQAQFEALGNALERQVLVAFERMKPALQALVGLFKQAGDEGGLFATIMQRGVVPVVIFFTRILLLMTVGFRNLQIAILKANEAWARLRGLLFDTTEEAEDYARVAEDLAAKNNATITTLNKLLEAYDKQPAAIDAVTGAAKGLGDELDRVDDAGGRVVKTLSELEKEAGITTLAVLKKNAEAARALWDALAAGDAPAFELKQAFEKLATANRAYRVALETTFATIVQDVELADTGYKGWLDTLELTPTAVDKALEALATLGVEGTATLIKKLMEAEEAYEQLKATGLASQADLLAAEIVIANLRLELHRQTGQAISEEMLENIEELKRKLAELRGEFEQGITAAQVWGDYLESITARMAAGVKINLSKIAVEALEKLEKAFMQSVQAWVLGGESLGVAMKRAAAQVLAGIAAQAAVLAIFELAAGFASLAVLDFRGAAQHFTAAGLYASVAVGAAVAAKAIAPKGRAATVSSETGEPIAVVTQGETQQKEGPLVVERRLAQGGLVTKPTLALLGERGDELVVPLRRGGGDGGGQGPGDDQPSPDGAGTTIQLVFERGAGVIDPTTLRDVMEQMTEIIREGGGELAATEAFSVTQRE